MTKAGVERSILVVAEHLEGNTRPITYELVAFAAQMERLEPARVGVIIIGEEIEVAATQIAVDTGVDVTAVEVPGVASYSAEAYMRAFEEVLQDLGPVRVCFGHTSQGLDLAPGLSIKMGAACIPGVSRVSMADGRMVFSRKMFGSKIAADVVPTTDTVVLTVEPGSHKSLEPGVAKAGSVDLRTMSFSPTTTTPVGLKRAIEESSALAQADVIVSVGRGIGKRENLDLAVRLCSLFSRAAVGGSRPVCDLGWLGPGQQVGQTGAIVSPRLYLACGISGASQHVAGIRGSGLIVAINTDPNAAIFNEADVCIVEDLRAFIPALIESCKKL